MRDESHSHEQCAVPSPAWKRAFTPVFRRATGGLRRGHVRHRIATATPSPALPRKRGREREAVPSSLISFTSVAALTLFSLLSPALAADPYPSKPVRLVVGFGAGGPTDIPARFVADKLGDLLGKRVIVENKTGAAGMIATRDVLAQ